MDNQVIINQNSEARENIIAGIVGAFLFSLAGAAIYFLLHLIGYIASISGLVGVVCAVKGYALFAKKESKKGVIIATVIALLVIVLAWYFCLAYDVYNAYKGFYEAGETDFYFTFAESVRVAPVLLEEPEIATAYYGDLALGLLFCLIGCGSYVFNKLKNANKATTIQHTADPVIEMQAANEQPQAEDTAAQTENTEETEETHIEH